MVIDSGAETVTGTLRYKFLGTDVGFKLAPTAAASACTSQDCYPSIGFGNGLMALEYEKDKFSFDAEITSPDLAFKSIHVFGTYAYGDPKLVPASGFRKGAIYVGNAAPEGSTISGVDGTAFIVYIGMLSPTPTPGDACTYDCTAFGGATVVDACGGGAVTGTFDGNVSRVCVGRTVGVVVGACDAVGGGRLSVWCARLPSSGQADSDAVLVGLDKVLYDGVMQSATPLGAFASIAGRVLALLFGGGVSQACRVRTRTGSIEGSDGGLAVRVWCGGMPNVTSVELVGYLNNLTRANGGGVREGEGVEGTTRQGGGGEASGLLVLCPQTTAEGQRACLVRAVCMGLVGGEGDEDACFVMGVAEACPRCDGGSKKGLLGLLGLLGLIPLVVCVACVACLCVCVARRRRARKGAEEIGTVCVASGEFDGGTCVIGGSGAHWGVGVLGGTTCGFGHVGGMDVCSPSVYTSRSVP
jgi:hypothetical protein